MNNICFNICGNTNKVSIIKVHNKSLCGEQANINFVPVNPIIKNLEELEVIRLFYGSQVYQQPTI